MIDIVRKPTHVEAYQNGTFLFSADTYSEAMEELKKIHYNLFYENKHPINKQEE